MGNQNDTQRYVESGEYDSLMRHWEQVSQQRYYNKLTNQFINKKMLKITNGTIKQQIDFYNRRMQDHNINTLRLIYFRNHNQIQPDSGYSYLDVYTETVNIVNTNQMKQCMCMGIINGFHNISQNYGNCRVKQTMIWMTNNSTQYHQNVRVWLNQRPYLNQSTPDTQSNMVKDIIIILTNPKYGCFCVQNIKIKQYNFQTLLQQVYQSHNIQSFRENRQKHSKTYLNKALREKSSFSPKILIKDSIITKTYSLSKQPMPQHNYVHMQPQLNKTTFYTNVMKYNQSPSYSSVINGQRPLRPFSANNYINTTRSRQSQIMIKKSDIFIKQTKVTQVPTHESKYHIVKHTPRNNDLNHIPKNNDLNYTPKNNDLNHTPRNNDLNRRLVSEITKDNKIIQQPKTLEKQMVINNDVKSIQQNIIKGQKSKQNGEEMKVKRLRDKIDRRIGLKNQRLFTLSVDSPQKFYQQRDRRSTYLIPDKTKQVISKYLQYKNDKVEKGKYFNQCVHYKTEMETEVDVEKYKRQHSDQQSQKVSDLITRVIRNPQNLIVNTDELMRNTSNSSINAVSQNQQRCIKEKVNHKRAQFAELKAQAIQLLL